MEWIKWKLFKKIIFSICLCRNHIWGLYVNLTLKSQRHVDIYLANSCSAEGIVAACLCSQVYELSGHVPKFSVPSELGFVLFVFLFVCVYANTDFLWISQSRICIEEGISQQFKEILKFYQHHSFFRELTTEYWFCISAFPQAASQVLPVLSERSCTSKKWGKNR